MLVFKITDMFNFYGYYNCDIKFFILYFYFIRYTDLEERNRIRELYGLFNIVEDKVLVCNVRSRYDTDIFLYFVIFILFKFVYVLVIKEMLSR